MGIVSYGQSGYAGASMSVRARDAYESGEMPMSKWTRSAIISAIKDYCADFDLAYNPEIESKSRTQLIGDYLEYKSWHHTGRFARETEFFGLNEDAVCADFPEMTPDQITERNDKAAAELFDERGLEDLLEAKREEAELDDDLGLVGESDCR